MLQLRTLGGIDARHADGRALTELLAQPKRTALLVYLSVARPAGFHRRDTLLALLWPELDEERARAALRRALSFIRRAAGPDVVVTRGDEVAIDAAVVQSDVAALDAAGADDPERVVRLYGGDFLAGFHLRGAPDFDQWQAAERDRLQRQVVRARWGLADRSVAAGAAEAATEHAAHAAALAPLDEAGVRRRLVLLRAVGEHAAGLRAYAEFAARLRTEYGTAPAEETRRIADSLRALPAAAPTTALVGTEPTPPPRGDARPTEAETEAAAEGTVPLRSDEAARRPGAWRRRTALLVSSLILAAGIGLRQRDTARAAAARASDGVRVAVLPFQVFGDRGTAYLDIGMVDLLDASFDGAGPWRPVDRYLLAGERAVLPATTPAEGQAIARRVGAQRFVLGSVVDVAGQMRVRATLYDTAGEARASATTAGPEAALVTMVDDLTRQLLAGEYPEGEPPLTRTAIRTTASLAALKSYLHAVQRLRDGRFGEAADSFRVAVHTDTSFALAYYGLSMSLAWQSAGRNNEATTSALQAVRHARTLGPHADALLRAHADAWSGRIAQAEQRYTRLLAAYPDDIEAWHELGELCFHSAALRGRPLSDARDAFEHVLASPALRPSALLHLVRLAALDEDAPRLDALAVRARAELGRDARAREVAMLATFAGAGATAAGRDAAITDLASHDADLIWTLGWSVAMYAADWTAAERLFGLLTDPARQPGDRALGWLAIAQVRAAAGRPAAAREAVARAATLAPAWATASGALLDALPFLRPTAAQRATSRAAVQRWNGSLPDLGSSIAVYPHPATAYRTGLLAALAAVPAAPRAMPPLPPVPPPPPLGRAAPLFPLTGLDRLAYGDALRNAGRVDEAVATYAAFPDADTHDVIYYAPAALARARAADARGDREGAARAYRRAGRLWRDAERPVRTGGALR